jgi:hypothetical protein
MRGVSVSRSAVRRAMTRARAGLGSRDAVCDDELAKEDAVYLCTFD